ncbi:MAG TPA: hypothetical protein VNA14_06140 [Mycobacteriales bacterium]|nr:hypothetical protein [Mycobacteriales bacterium]
MRLIARAALAVAVAAASSVLLAAPADATECTPKGCSGGCSLNPAALDPNDPTSLGPLIVCYS